MGVTMAYENTCACCGEIIPEGRWVCPGCFLQKEFQIPKKIKEQKKRIDILKSVIDGTDVLVICRNDKEAYDLYKALCLHFKRWYGASIRCDHARREFAILTTDVRVVSKEQYYMKCKCGFRGRALESCDVWQQLAKDEERFRIKKEEI